MPPFHRDLLTKAGIAEAGGRALPDRSPGAALEQMALLGTGTAILSVSTPGTGFLAYPREAVALARRLNDHGASLAAGRPDRFGLFATLPMPDPAASATEAARALDGLGADGVTLPANNQGTYLGAPGQDPLRRVLDDRRRRRPRPPRRAPGPIGAGHPALRRGLPARHVPGGIPAGPQQGRPRPPPHPVRPQPRRRFPAVRLPRMAAAISAATGRSSLDVLDDFRSFSFDTALSAGPAALPSLLAFARPGHVLFGNDWPFAPSTAGQYFATGLDTGVEAGHAGGGQPRQRRGALPPSGRRPRGPAERAGPGAPAAGRPAPGGPLFELVQPDRD
ncbi:amidohydrolase family protein [Streptomyces brasiliscabiei]|uniref:Amidohydrolase family protein n=1 Tax=Streptomyces brasiliscabiei TaxID=2736302 RepID=A0ABU8G963_9ACTN